MDFKEVPKGALCHHRYGRGACECRISGRFRCERDSGVCCCVCPGDALSHLVAVDYMHYRESTLGRALEDSLSDMVERNVITVEQKDQVRSARSLLCAGLSRTRMHPRRRCASLTSA